MLGSVAVHLYLSGRAKKILQLGNFSNSGVLDDSLAKVALADLFPLLDRLAAVVASA